MLIFLIMKRIFCFVLAFFSFFLISAQSPSIRLGVLKGVSCAPCAYLIENKAKLAVQNLSFKVFDSQRTEAATLLRGEIDAGFINPSDAAKIFSKTEGALVALGVSQNGNLFLVTGDSSYSSLADLKGRSVLCDENDSDGTKVFTHLFQKKFPAANDPQDSSEGSISIDLSVPKASIANSLILQKSDFALLCEPFATVALSHSKNLRRAENIQKIYSDLEEKSAFPAMLLVVRADFAKENRDLIRKFVEIYKAAVNWTNRNPVKAGFLAEKHKIFHSPAVITNSIPNAAIVWRDAVTAKPDLEKFFEIIKIEPPAGEFYFR